MNRHTMMGYSRDTKAKTYRRTVLQSRRLAIFGALLVAVVFPALLRVLLGVSGGDSQLVQNTILGSAAAVLLGYYIYQSITIYPGIQAAYFVLPIFLVSYAIVAFVLLFARFEYNRLILLTSFLACLLWFFILEFIPDRRRPLAIGVIPIGAVDGLDEIGKVQWRKLLAPDLAQVDSLDILVADLHADLPPEWERFIADATLRGLVVLHVKTLRESLTGRVQMDHLSENSFGSLVPLSAYLRIKKLLDFLSAAVALLLLSPALMFIAIIVRIDSPGTSLFRQVRIGYAGEPFTVFKFRTMRSDTPAASDRQQAMTGDNDPRITRLGRFLRRTRIDELPQIFNILRGEMSWIGPRPEASVLSEWYERELPFYRYRHVVRPGITGWAQVNQGHVSDVEQVLGKLHYDFYYIRHFSPWLDALIVVRTIQTMVTGFGSR